MFYYTKYIETEVNPINISSVTMFCCIMLFLGMVRSADSPADLDECADMFEDARSTLAGLLRLVVARASLKYDSSIESLNKILT